ncbi:short-chain fatty acyl-CoA regulator family protein [Defluviimonas sp. WL0002]|uniref:Short-chain fatty acyl-CoA regulator family protein n=1 Tax=Albidovulum marisflavi TaxID=2984159 RepID=A0ABT2ZGC5_9RHOB|nr:helix-turn-helix transcriptional regulator [Defluviimonas sp. WL0002]MCV2870188.1 short-chain fatty acyl-CoA regulator family protein [Defluviimonas sp. WL0002]
MARGALTGSRVRERRALAGLKQADLARAAGISAAYLNLIEHNRRRVGPELLSRLAAALGVDETSLAEGGKSALFDALREAAAGVGAGEVPPEVEQIEEFAGRFPGWAALLAARQRRVGDLERTVEALTERMAHDPHLSASLHEVLSAVTSVRSTAAILAETEDIEPRWRALFHRNLGNDSLRLSEAAAALVAYLDLAKEAETGPSSPQEEVEAWLANQNYHVAALEGASAPAPEDLVQGAVDLATTPARRLAVQHLTRYRQDALAMPLGAFRKSVAELGQNPSALARAFGTRLTQVFRRLASLPPDEGMRQVGLVVCDAAGAFTFRKPAPGFALPRHGAACPLWPLYEALARPGVPIRAVMEVAGRVPQRFEVFAIGEVSHPQGFDGPTVSEAAMLVLPAATVRTDAELMVGAACRICPRADCAARREPSILLEGV